MLEVLSYPISELLLFIQKLPATLEDHELELSSEVIHEIALRLIYLNDLGLTFLSPQFETFHDHRKKFWLEVL
jgi:excinuclease UvrABC ATPase subunit